MEADRGSTRPSVADALFVEGEEFDFYQAVHLLERLDPRRVPVGVESDPDREVVRFTSAVGMDFPATDVVSVSRAEGGEPPRMEVAFLGLAGALGPLPQPFAELVLERAWRGDQAPRAFLDLFNHRLVSLLYRARKRAHPALQTGELERSPMVAHLLSLAGVGTEGLRKRMSVPDRALLRYTGLLAQRPRSLAGLLAILRDYFGVPVEAEQFIGRWLPLAEDEQTRIGSSGQNRKLGEGAVLGSRVWDQDGVFELRVGPLSLEELRDFLPPEEEKKEEEKKRSAFRRLCDLTRLYVGVELDFTLRLVLRAGEMPRSHLNGGMQLGRTSWLCARSSTADDAQVRVACPSAG